MHFQLQLPMSGRPLAEQKHLSDDSDDEAPIEQYTPAQLLSTFEEINIWWDMRI